MVGNQCGQHKDEARLWHGGLIFIWRAAVEGVAEFEVLEPWASGCRQGVVGGGQAGGPGPWHFLCELGVGCRGNKYGIDQVL